MIDLYGMSSPNALKIVLMLEELELPYRFHWVNVWKGEQFSADFLCLNPNAKVPVLVDPDGPEGEPYTVFESGAILIYLAEKAGRFLPAGGRARHDAFQWLMIQLTGVGPMFGQYVHFSRYAPDGQDYGRSRYRTEALRLLDLLDVRLGEVPYLGGADYTIADISTYPWLRMLDFFGFDTGSRPNLKRWLDDIAGRPAAARMAAKADEIRPSDVEHVTASRPEDFDRIFGRGAYARTA